MSQFNDIITSLKEKIDILQTLQEQFGSSSHLQKINNRYNALNQINFILDNATNNLQWEMQTTLDSIFKLREDIKRISLVQSKSNWEDLGFEQNNFTLTEFERYLYSKRNSMLKNYFQDLIIFSQSTDTNYSILLNSKLNDISINDFNELNQFIINNFNELQDCDFSKTHNPKPTLTLNTILDTYSDLSIHTPLNQIKLPSISASSPTRKIYRTPQNLVVKPKKKNSNSNYSGIRNFKIDTKMDKNKVDNTQLFYSKESLYPTTPLQRLLSPIKIIKKRISNTEYDNETLDSPIVEITPTKFEIKSNSREKALSCKITNGLMKSC